MALTAITRARAAALLAGGAVFCASAAAVRAQANAPLRLGMIPIEGAADAYFANDMGFFSKAGLDVDIQQLPTGAAIAAAVVSGALDVGFGSIDALAGIHQKGVPLVVIAPASEYISPATQRTSGLVVPANSTVQNGKDLNGKTIAVIALNSITYTSARAWIDQNGGDSTQAKFIEVPSTTMTAALQAGRVDAAVVAQPFLAAAAASGRVLVYGFDVVANHFLVSGWFTTPEWAKGHPDLVRRFAAAMHDAAVWANGNPAPSADILAKHTKIDPAVIATEIRSRFGEQLTPALLQPLIDISAKYNNFAPFPAQALLYAPPRQAR